MPAEGGDRRVERREIEAWTMEEKEEGGRDKTRGDENNKTENDKKENARIRIQDANGWGKGKSKSRTN